MLSNARGTQVAPSTEIARYAVQSTDVMYGVITFGITQFGIM